MLHYRKPCICRVPCAETFAVGKTSGTRQRQGLPCATRTGTRQSCSTRQSKDLPCARQNGPRQRSGTRQRWRPVTPFGRPSPLPCASIKHTAKILFAVCFILCTRQRFSKTVEFGLRKFFGIRIQEILLHAKLW